MICENTPEAFTANARKSTEGFGLLGWCCSMSWLVVMMWSYDIFVLGDMAYFEGSWFQFLFMLLFAIFTAFFGFLFGQNPDGLAKLARYTTPVVIGVTAVIGLAPQPLCAILYVVSPLFMSPAIARLGYGVVSAAQGLRLTRYMAGFSVSFLAFALWVILIPSKEAAFLFSALLAVPAWIGIRHSQTIPVEAPVTGALKTSKQFLFTLMALVVVMFWLIILGRMLLTNIFAGMGGTPNRVLDTLMTWVPVSFSMLLFAVISDKGYERAGFICGMCLSLVGIMLAILLSNAQGALSTPLVLAFCFGEIYAEYFAYTIPINFLENVKRPVFASSLGCVFYLVISALEWKKDIWLPRIFMELGTPLLVTAAIATIIFIVMVYFLFERHREQTLAAALSAMLHRGEADGPRPAVEPPEEPAIMEDLLSSEEIDVAMLLIEGETRYGISRKLHQPVADVNRNVENIREKVIRRGDPDPGIATAVREFGLTRRETDTLRCLCRNMTNVEIASHLVIAEETVKKHVRSLMRKLPLEDRKEVGEWVRTLGM